MADEQVVGGLERLVRSSAAAQNMQTRTTGALEDVSNPSKAEDQSPSTAHSTSLDWDGPDDVDDPRNWPVPKKVIHSAIPALYGFALTVGTSTFVAAVPEVMRQFDVSKVVAVLPVVVYTVGFTLGPLVAAPISEIYGRRIIYWSNLPMLCVFNAIAAASNNLAVLIIFRFLAGFGGSGILAVGAGTVADMWNPQQAGRVGLSYVLAPFLGPCLGPLVGAYIVAEYNHDWKYSIWIILILCAPVAVAMMFMSETFKDRILYLREKKREHRPIGQTDRAILIKKMKVAMFRPLHMTFVEVFLAWTSSLFQSCS